MAENARIKLNIKGRVQGVFFRLATQKKALALGLFGWVKNNNDGSVFVVVEGQKDNILDFLSWCQKGPIGASVKDITTEWQEYQSEFNDFKIN